MFDIGSSELLLIIVVAVVVIGPKDLPRALYKVGQVVGKARGMARHFRTGLDAMIREAELEELQKQWAKENERIMAETRLPDMTGTPKALTDETAQGEAGVVAAAPAPETAGPVDHAAPAAAQPAPAAQPALPLDTPAHDAPKGSAA